MVLRRAQQPFKPDTLNLSGQLGTGCIKAESVASNSHQLNGGKADIAWAAPQRSCRNGAAQHNARAQGVQKSVPVHKWGQFIAEASSKSSSIHKEQNGSGAAELSRRMFAGCGSHLPVSGHSIRKLVSYSGLAR